jgi:hypothetical protein
MLTKYDGDVQTSRRVFLIYFCAGTTYTLYCTRVVL